MSDYDNTNRGSIWKNDKKDTESHPDFTGSINVEGKEYWVSAWKRKPDANPKSPALSLSVKPKEDKQSSPSQANQNFQTPVADEGFDDDIPFN